MRRRTLPTVAASVLLLLAGCATDGSTSGPAGATQGGYAPITVDAAASLTGTFDRIARTVESETGTTVTVNYAGSSDLVAQLAAGAPGDVFASADERQMEAAVGHGSVPAQAARTFATNSLTIVTPPGNPAHVSGLADLAAPAVQTVVCAPQVPCGAATARVLSTAGLTVKPVSEEAKVTDVLGKVSSGQADAGLVYVTDARRAGRSVTVVPTPEAATVVNTYPIAVTTQATQDPARRRTAEKFVEAVLSAQGRRLLEQAGFGPPPTTGR